MIQTKVIQDLELEPVTLADCKEFMEIDYNDFDDLLVKLLKSARIASEKFTGLSYGVRTYKLVSDQCEVVLPFYPFIEIVETTATDYTTFGLDQTLMMVRNQNQWEVTYKSGFAELPDDLKYAIFMRVETAFKYRADATDEAVNKAINASTELEFAYRINPMF